MPPEAHVAVSDLDLTRVVADIEGIRRVNPQRFEMEQITSVFLLDRDKGLIGGYKDVQPDEFWVRGHMPDYPLLPGVLMCEAAAQLASFYTASQGLAPGQFIGFSGMENVRFRATVRPGDRLVLIGKLLKTGRQIIFGFQGFVGTTMVFHAEVIGVFMTRALGADSA